MKKPFLLVFLLFAVAACIGISTIITPAKVTLIPRAVLFGCPSKTLARISPNGNYISYLAPLNSATSTLNIWIRSIDKNDDRAITNVTDRSIQSYFWAPNGNQILYVRDTKGDENWQLYGITVPNGKVTCYTPFEKVQTKIIACNKFYPDTLLIGLNKDNPQVHDVYKLDLVTGNLELIEKNPGTISDWVADKDLVVRGATMPTENGGTTLLVRKDPTSAWQTARTWDHEDYTLSGPLDFSYDGKSLYLFDSKDADTSRLVKMDLDTKEIEVLAEDPHYDVHSVHINSDTGHVDAVSFIKDYEEWKVLNPEFQKILVALTTIDKGNLYILGVDNKQEKWVVCIEHDTKSATFYLYDSTQNKTMHLFDLRPALNKHTLAPCEPIMFTARDGLSIHGYLTCPPNVERKNLPLVLLVHGGPWARDTWGYRAEVQWLSNRGYAVLQINFRGSTGYGKKFVNAANKEWAGKMHDDLIDAVQWATKSGIANPKKVAIYGASYGGYAALVGATFTPDVFCCAVDIVGPCNLITLLKSSPSYWVLHLNEIYKCIGNPQTEEQFLKDRSPLFKVQNIKIPLLIAQGAQDPRVTKEEAEQIVTALKAHNIPHEYLLFEDEGHGFVKYENKQKFYATTEKFLAQHLGGTYES